MTEDELDKFVDLVVALGLIGGREFSVKSLWGKSWGCPIFSQTMARDKFPELIRFLKTERRRNLLHDKFSLASQLWNIFISNCQKAFIPQCSITVDEQLLPFTLQVHPIDVESKYFFIQQKTVLFTLEKMT